MIDLDTVQSIHNILIDKFGGSKGIRDLKALEAALARPDATFEQHDLYPEIIDKATALFESLIINHPFIDGNKRIAYVILRLVLQENSMDIDATQDDKYDFVIAASKGEYRFEEIRAWLTKHVVNKNEP
mgnify:CR=1 FL=1